MNNLTTDIWSSFFSTASPLHRSVPVGGGGGSLLLEDGSGYILLENGGQILLEG